MREGIKTVLTIAPLFLVFLFHSCEALAKKPDVAVWLARSCVGEAGFDSGSTGECAAILHIYRKRANLSRFNLYEVVRKYSAAVKPGPHQLRRWVFHLSRDLKRPRRWNERLRWKDYRDRWATVLQLCDEFLTGTVADPVPLADHYGGYIDRWRARRQGWFKLDTPFRNDFWSIINPKKKETKNGRINECKGRGGTSGRIGILFPHLLPRREV